jgi:hypothetical protein
MAEFVSGTVTTGEPGAIPAAALPSDGGNVGGLLAGKFTNAEELAKGYTNLATLLGKQGKIDDAQLAAVIAKLPSPAPAATDAAAVAAADAAAEAAAAAPVPKKDPLQISAEDQAAAAASAAGLKLEEMNEEYAKTGELSEASYAKLAKVGISKEIVGAFIAGQEAVRTQVEQRAYSLVGGEENYTTMLSWAKTGFTPEETEAYNAAVIGTPAAQALAITGLKARFEAAAGSGPALIRGDSPAGVGGGYQSRAQVTADIKDPRYDRDPAYRKAVEDKLKRSVQLA